jgi:hypothetical protein
MEGSARLGALRRLDRLLWKSTVVADSSVTEAILIIGQIRPAAARPARVLVWV